VHEAPQHAQLATVTLQQASDILIHGKSKESIRNTLQTRCTLERPHRSGMEEDAKFLKHELIRVFPDLEQRGDLAAVQHQDYPFCISRDKEGNYKQSKNTTYCS